jgi:hypothetical protein
MRRQYKYNHRTDNNQFERKELITRLGNNCALSWSPTWGSMMMCKTDYARLIGLGLLTFL